MTSTPCAGPSYDGVFLADLPGAFAPLDPATPWLADAHALRERMRRDGYLFLPGLLDRDVVRAARDSILARLDAEGLLDTASPREQAVARPGKEMAFRPDLANRNPAVEALLYGPGFLGFWEHFLGGAVLHFDFTWLRARSPGKTTVTPPHCDTVFMSRGTPNLFTAWTPLDDIPYELGGLMILEGSHRCGDVLEEYWKMDVDRYCSNGPEAAAIESGRQSWPSAYNNGIFAEDAVGLQRDLGGRWLGTEYRADDVLVFGMHTLHAAADNRTPRIRLSTDSRYQLASEPADGRWIGPSPVGHGPAGKRAMIC